MSSSEQSESESEDDGKVKEKKELVGSDSDEIEGVWDIQSDEQADLEGGDDV